MNQQTNLLALAYDMKTHPEAYQAWHYDDTPEPITAQSKESSSQHNSNKSIRIAFATILNIFSR